MHIILEQIFKELEERSYTKLKSDTVVGEFNGFPLKLGAEPWIFTTKEGMIYQINNFHNDSGFLHYFLSNGKDELDYKKIVVEKSMLI